MLPGFSSVSFFFYFTEVGKDSCMCIMCIMCVTHVYPFCSELHTLKDTYIHWRAHCFSFLLCSNTVLWITAHQLRQIFLAFLYFRVHSSPLYEYTVSCPLPGTFLGYSCHSLRSLFSHLKAEATGAGGHRQPLLSAAIHAAVRLLCPAQEAAQELCSSGDTSQELENEVHIRQKGGKNGEGREAPASHRSENF